MNQDLISRQAILKHIEKKRQDALMIDDLRESNIIMMGMKLLEEAVRNQPSAQPEKMQLSKEDATKGTTFDCISRKDAIDVLHGYFDGMLETDTVCPADIYGLFECVPSAQPERKWIPCSNPPKHHKDVIVRGIEAIGNVTVHKVMQWDVDTWRPTDYAPSIIWKEWSEI